MSDHNEAIRVKPNDPDFYDDRQYRVKSIEVGLSCSHPDPTDGKKNRQTPMSFSRYAGLTY